MYDVTVILPCLNEEESVGICVEKCLDVFKKNNINGEVLVVDNGSTDDSAKIANEKGARVVEQPIKGYGAAYLKGLDEAKGKYGVMADADDTYDFYDMPKLIVELDAGADMAIASRFMGKMQKGAMSFSHRYIGNPILTTMLNLFFRSTMSDCHSGFRAFRLDVIRGLGLQTTGMEFASEMIVAALREKINIKEIPTVYRARIGESKLNGIVDAWRHIRFLLLFSPDWLFLLPGTFLFVVGLVGLLLSGFGKLVFAGHVFDVHAMICFAFFILTGFQIINLGLYAKKYALTNNFIKSDRMMAAFEKLFKLESGLILGGASLFAGFIGMVIVLSRWISAGMGPLNEVMACLLSLLLFVCGIQVLFSAFFLSLLNIKRRTDV